MEEEEKILKRNSTVSFNRRLSIYEKLKYKYAKEWSIHVAFNYYEGSKPTIRYWIKEKRELMLVTKNEHS